MKHVNLNKLSYEQFRSTYKHFLREIDFLKTQLKEAKESNVDSNASLYKRLEAANHTISQISRYVPKGSSTPQEQDFTIDQDDELQTPTDFSQNHGDGKVNEIGAFDVTRNSHYIITCSSVIGQTLSITQQDTNQFNSVQDKPSSNTGNYVQFIGDNQDDGSSADIRLEFISKVNGELFITPSLPQFPVKNYKFIQHGYAYDDPDFPNDRDIPVPNAAHTGKTPQTSTDKKALPLLKELVKRIKSRDLDIVNMNYNTDENNNVSYSFSADPIRQMYDFIQAANQLNGVKGMKRTHWKRDEWIEMDADNNLVIKYRGNDRLFPYQPSKKDLDAKDWVVEYVRPFNPNTKPYGSDPYDDSTDTDNYGFDGSFINQYDD